MRLHGSASGRQACAAPAAPAAQRVARRSRCSAGHRGAWTASPAARAPAHACHQSAGVRQPACQRQHASAAQRRYPSNTSSSLAGPHACDSGRQPGAQRRSSWARHRPPPRPHAPTPQATRMTSCSAAASWRLHSILASCRRSRRCARAHASGAVWCCEQQAPRATDGGPDTAPCCDVHIRLLRAQAGLHVGGVMGTSAGALAGSLYAAGYSPREVRCRSLSRRVCRQRHMHQHQATKPAGWLARPAERN